MKYRIRCGAASLFIACLLSAVGAGQEQRAEAPLQDKEKDERLARVLKRVGESVERYQGGLFSIAFTETMREEKLKRDLSTPDGRAREYVFDNIALRQKIAEGEDEIFAKTIRRTKTVNGKPAKEAKPHVEKRKCGNAGPGDSYADPLTFLLPKMQPRYEFTDEGEETLEGRKTHVVGFVPRGQGGPKVVQKDDCFWATLPFKGRIWVDAESGDVLRLEWRLIESYEYESPRAMKIGALRFGPKRRFNYERFESVTRFRRVEFKDPAQTLLLPAAFESLRVIEGASLPRVRVTRTFTDYRRFVSDVKVIEDAEPNN